MTKYESTYAAHIVCIGQFCNRITQHEKSIVSTAYVRLPSWSSLCLLKIHMEYVGRVRVREGVCREEKMVSDLL